MYRILLTIVATSLLVVFGMQNSDHVPVSLIFGSPIQIRLMFLLSLAAMAGFLVSHILGLSKEIQLKRQIRRLKAVYEADLAKRRHLSNEEENDDWRRAS
jgi:uncharacterized integral membrane protein